MKAKLSTKTAMLVLGWIGLLLLNARLSAAVEAGVYFIDIDGKGNATLIKTISGSTASYGLVDTGSSSDYNTYVAPYLATAMGSAKLSFIALSHMHADHMGGAITAINSSLCDANTTLYIKDVASGSDTDHEGESDVATRVDNIIAAAKTKSMAIGKIKPYETFDNDVGSISEIQSLSANKFKAKIERFTKNTSGSYVSVGVYDTITFGKFTLTWFNGNNWNHESVVEDLTYSPSGPDYYWDENANAASLLLKCVTSTNTTFRTYLGADIGENSAGQYSYEIAAKVHAAVGTAVSVYQVAHHGYYYSLKPNTIASTLNPKFAIVTNSYNEIVNAYYDNHGITNPTSSDLSTATNTLKETLNSTVLQKMYFLSGKGANPDNRIIDALKDNNYALLNWTGTTIKAGTVKVEYDGSTQTVSQP